MFENFSLKLFSYFFPNFNLTVLIKKDSQEEKKLKIETKLLLEVCFYE